MKKELKCFIAVVMIAMACFLVSCTHQTKVAVNELELDAEKVELSVSGKRVVLDDNDNWEKAGLSLNESQLQYWTDVECTTVASSIETAKMATITLDGQIAKIALDKE